jgi:hypothetical protein
MEAWMDMVAMALMEVKMDMINMADKEDTDMVDTTDNHVT